MTKPSEERMEQLMEMSHVVCGTVNKGLREVVLSHLPPDDSDREEMMVITNGIIAALVDQLCVGITASIQAGFLQEDVIEDMGAGVIEGCHDLLAKMREMNREETDHVIDEERT